MSARPERSASVMVIRNGDRVTPGHLHGMPYRHDEVYAKKWVDRWGLVYLNPFR
jgi:hypothetical protein